MLRRGGESAGGEGADRWKEKENTPDEPALLLWGPRVSKVMKSKLQRRAAKNKPLLFARGDTKRVSRRPAGHRPLLHYLACPVVSRQPRFRGSQMRQTLLPSSLLTPLSFLPPSLCTAKHTPFPGSSPPTPPKKIGQISPIVFRLPSVKFTVTLNVF